MLRASTEGRACYPSVGQSHSMLKVSSGLADRVTHDVLVMPPMSPPDGMPAQVHVVSRKGHTNSGYGLTL